MVAMKGIIAAGGYGLRLGPLTRSVNKHLLPVYSKPMIYYPLGTLMLAGVREFEIVTNKKDIQLFENLLGNGETFGISISYKIQEKANGIAEVFILSEKFINDSPVALILGDNIFYGSGLGNQLSNISVKKQAQIFGYKVINPKEYGVALLDTSGKILEIEEKPDQPKSSIAIPGLYFYSPDVVDYAKNLKPSSRGELEITAINQKYLGEGRLNITLLERSTVWVDAGTIESLFSISNYISVVENRQGNIICCLEEIALSKGWITIKIVQNQAKLHGNSAYGKYLADLVKSH